MNDHAAIFETLEQFAALNALALEEAETLSESLAYEPAQQYLNMLLRRVKPETAASELFKAIAKDALNVATFPEVSVSGGGFVDFALEQAGGNPVVLELKPLLTFDKASQTLKSERLLPGFFQKQIQKYLASPNEYVILTNLRDVYVFSREALIHYAPFHQAEFAQFLRDALAFETLWDYLRRIEDRIPRHDLDVAFFADLKKWHGELRAVAWQPIHGLTTDELIVLFLNKMIFIKTLEDYGLIPFKFIEHIYKDRQAKWQTKGQQAVFLRFFRDVEEWCYLFYDTELFTVNVWEAIVADAANVTCFRQKFETVMGFGEWQQAFGKGLIHYNYRQVDEDVFGKAYETFLAENRKDSGIYYTPQPLTRYMAEQLVSALFDGLTDTLIAALHARDYEQAQQAFERMRAIAVIDPCSGSGSFLIKTLRAIYARYERIKAVLDAQAAEAVALREQSLGQSLYIEQPAWVKALDAFRKSAGFDDARRLISMVILRHIYAADADERALDTAKANLWKEAVKLDPRSFGYTKLPQDRNHVLPSLTLNVVNGDSLADLPSEDAIRLIARDFQDDIRQLHAIRAAYLRNPFEPERLPEARRVKRRILDGLRAELPDLPRPLIMAVEFFFVYFDADGKPLPPEQRGFDAIISNPPWEAIKPVKKEFAKIGKGDLDVKDFTAWFEEEKRRNAEFRAKWDAYVQSYRQYSAFLQTRYTHQGAGDPNFYKMFIERDLELLKMGGRAALLVPSGIQTDSGTADLRRLLLQTYALTELSSFENRGYAAQIDGKEAIIKPFPDVDGRFKFSILLIKKECGGTDIPVCPSNAGRQTGMSVPPTQFAARFYLHHPDELQTPPIAYDLAMIKKFSPENWSIMEFRAEDDYRLCAKIMGNHRYMQECGYALRSEFHMTNDSHLFEKRQASPRDFALYEGKMIHQYDSFFASARYYIAENEGKKSLVEKKVNGLKKLKIPEKELEAFLKNERVKLDCEDYKLVFRDVGRSTDERTIISTILPKNVFTGNTLNHVVNFSYDVENGNLRQHHIGYANLVYLLALLNSLTLNYYIRNKITAHVSIFYAYELPLPAATDAQRAAIVSAAFTLLARHDATGAFAELGRALGVSAEPQADPTQIRAALEVLIARELFGLSAAEWQHLTSTFTYGSPASATRQELDRIIAASRALFAVAET